jgi:hypothetical protein
MTGYQSKKKAASAKTIDEVHWVDHEPDGLAQPAQEPYKGMSEYMAQATKGRVRIDPATGDVGIGTPPAQPEQDVAAFEAALQKQFQRDYAIANTTQPTLITFNSGNAEWVMRITADRHIEVNEGVEVSEAAQKVLDALQNLLRPAQEPVCPACKAEVLYECVACSSNNYPPAAQPAQEPVGKFAKFTNGIWREVTDGSPGVPLYTAPQRPWADLTDDELVDLWYKESLDWMEFARAVLARSKEKNGITNYAHSLMVKCFNEGYDKHLEKNNG